MANSNLTNAKRAKNDEFYTQYSDIQKEIQAYLDFDKKVFRNKTVYCNCDDPYESNFFRYFVLNFKKLGLKKLITTSYKPSPVANTQLGLFGDDKTLTHLRQGYGGQAKQKGRPKITANKFIVSEVGDIDNDGEFNLKDIAKQLKENKNNEWSPLEGDGDFRSPECIELLKQSDIVVTNPPFSLFREYVKQLFDFKKKFVIIGNMNAITYKEVFPKIKENKMWLGATNFNKGMYFQVSNDFVYADTYKFEREQNGVKVNRVPGVCWFTNLDHGRRHQPLPLMTESEILKFGTKKSFQKYDNYNAIEISLAKYIPSDYKGVMGVPISFLDKYNPDQFEILGATQRGCHDDVPDTKKYDDYWEVRQNGKKTGSSGGKTNENANLVGNDGKKNYFINKNGRIIQSAYQRIFIKHKKNNFMKKENKSRNPEIILSISSRFAKEYYDYLCKLEKIHTIDEIEESKELIIIHRAVWTALIIEIGKLFDTHSKNKEVISLKKLPCFENCTWKQKIDSIHGDAIIQKIIKTRNTFTAHFSKENEKTISAPEICNSKLGKLLNDLDKPLDEFNQWMKSEK